MQTTKRKSQNFLTFPQSIVLVLAGIVLGHGLIFLENYVDTRGTSQKILAQVQEEKKIVFSSKNITQCLSACSLPPEQHEVKSPEPIQSPVAPKKAPAPKAAVNRPGTTRLADLPKKIKNPNAIRISLAEAPTILSEVKMVNGRATCAKRNDKGHKSDKYSDVHIDRQCCLDPDEIPNPRCLYK